MTVYSHSKQLAILSAAFYNTGLDAWTSLIIPQNGNTNISIGTAVAFCGIMNMAFSCEIGLKAWLPFNTKGHNLRILYEQLDVNEQDEVVNAVIQDAMMENKNKRSVIAPLNCPDKTSFLALLDKCSSNFVDSRYIYEQKNVSFPFGFMASLSRMLLLPQGIILDQEGKHLMAKV